MIDAERFSRLVDAAADGLKERGDIVAGALLAVLSGRSVFFYGPPGTAKSLIARRLSGCFKSSVFFECLMNRFTTPEEIFGPVSIRELKTSGSRFYAVIVDNGGCGYHEMPPPGFDGVWRFRTGDCSLTALKEPARVIGNG